MADTGDLGYGAAMTFSTGYFAMVRSIRHEGMSRASVPKSHSDLTNGWLEKLASDIKDAGRLVVEFLTKPDSSPKTPLTAAPGSVVLTFPVPSGSVNGATLTCNGFMTEHGDDIPHDGLMIRTGTVELSGEPTYASAS